jgi:hypothetical protein
MKTNLFIVGAAKSGTTSFHTYLAQHPEIVMSTIKEPNFFSNKEVLHDNLYYIAAPLVKTIEEYNSLFVEKCNEKIYGESSVSYLFYPGVAKRLKDYNEKSKILIFLRNPIQRAFSHYLMDYTAGYVNIPFADLIENSSLNPKAYQQTISQGLYSNKVDNYIKAFGKDQVKVIILEEVQNDMMSVIKDIEGFLDLSSFNNYNFETRNSYSYSNSLLIKYFYRSQRLKKCIKFVINRQMINNLKTLFLRAQKPIMKNDCKLFLKELYKEDVQKLSNLINKDLTSIWKFN